MIQLEHVSKFILSDVTLHVPEGTSVGLIGESGAGKTTLLKLASGLLLQEEGRVSVMGHNPVKYRKRYRQALSTRFIGIPLLAEEESIRTGMELIAAVYQMSRREFVQEYEALAEQLGYGAYEEQPVKSLSLGQRSRAELGAALLYRPKLLLLDEPTIGLDQEVKGILRELLQLRVEQGMTLLLSSHDMNEVSHLCDRIALLHKGRLAFYGEQKLLHRKYHSLQTMELQIDGPLPDLGDIPFYRYTIDGDHLTLIYSSHYITSAEILGQIMRQTRIAELVIRQSDLGQVILHGRQPHFPERIGGDT